MPKASMARRRPPPTSQRIRESSGGREAESAPNPETQRSGRPPIPLEVRRIEIVKDRICDLKIHTAELVDQVDEAVQADPHVIVDVDLEVALDCGDRRLRPAELVCRADLANSLPANRDPQVAWDREQGRLFGARINTHQDHRLGIEPIRRKLGVVVRSQQQDGEWLSRDADRVQVWDRRRTGRRVRGGLKDRQEIRAQATKTGEQETENDNQGTSHTSVRPSTRATLERGQKPVLRPFAALLAR